MQFRDVRDFSTSTSNDPKSDIFVWEVVIQQQVNQEVERAFRFPREC